MISSKLHEMITRAVRKLSRRLNRLDDINRVKWKVGFLIAEIEEVEEKLSDIKSSLHALDDMLDELYKKELERLCKGG